jgi:hypothetical protein
MIMLASERLKALALILAGALALTGCKKIDPKEVETDIQKDTESKGLKLASVTCPAGLPLKEGTKFECACTDIKGTAGAFDVEIANAHGRLEWKLRNKFMRMSIAGDGLEAKLSKKLNEVVDVVCPADNIIIKTGVSFSCDMKAGGKTATITLTPKDDQGVDWDEKIVYK